jgi:hypothetical protein
MHGLGGLVRKQLHECLLLSPEEGKRELKDALRHRRQINVLSFQLAPGAVAGRPGT